MIVEFKFRVFYSDSNGYTVAKYKNIETGKKVTCVGYYLPTEKNKKYLFDSESATNSKYGKYENVAFFTDYIDEKTDDPAALLTSLIKGVGAKAAEKVVKKLGNECLTLLKENPDIIETVNVTKKQQILIRAFFKEQSLLYDISKYFFKYGLSPKVSAKIAYFYSDSIWTVLKENPYDLCSIRELSFPVVDIIAKDNGVREDNYERLKAASLYVLKQDWMNGNVCTEMYTFINRVVSILDSESIDKYTLVKPVLQMLDDKALRYRKRENNGVKQEFIYHPHAYNTEVNIFKNVDDITKKKKREVKNIDNLIEKYSKGLILSDNQKEAIKTAVTCPIFVITGGPGTGKTTILRIVADINKELNKTNNNVFLSPTGRAARRITESTGYEAFTIHKRLSLGVLGEEGCLLEDFSEKISDSRIIVDESSMIDLWVMNALMKSLDNSSIGFIGDPDQLPSVGCGSILRDLIDCKAIPVVKLNQIYRQSNDAINICDNALKINKGITELTFGEDFSFIETSTAEKTEDEMVDAFIAEVNKYGLENVKCLCPYRKETAGVYSLNKRIQDRVNPLGSRYELPIRNNLSLRTKDLVMQHRNTVDVANGDIGTVIYVDDKEVDVDFSEHIETYSIERAKDELSLAYATTIHKSQGSEYDSVILCFNDFHLSMLKRNLIYTGITRGKKKVSIFGQRSAVNKAILNATVNNRNSFLKYLFFKKYNIIVASEDNTKVISENSSYNQLSLF